MYGDKVVVTSTSSRILGVDYRKTWLSTQTCDHIEIVLFLLVAQCVPAEEDEREEEREMKETNHSCWMANFLHLHEKDLHSPSARDSLDSLLSTGVAMATRPKRMLAKKRNKILFCKNDWNAVIKVRYW